MTNKKLILCILAILMGAEVRAPVDLVFLFGIGAQFAGGIAGGIGSHLAYLKANYSIQGIYNICVSIWDSIPKDVRDKIKNGINTTLSKKASTATTYIMSFISNEIEYELEIDFFDILNPEQLKDLLLIIQGTLSTGIASHIAWSTTTGESINKYITKLETEINKIFNQFINVWNSQANESARKTLEREKQELTLTFGPIFEKDVLGNVGTKNHSTSKGQAPKSVQKIHLILSQGVKIDKLGVYTNHADEIMEARL